MMKMKRHIKDFSVLAQVLKYLLRASEWIRKEAGTYQGSKA